MGRRTVTGSAACVLACAMAASAAAQGGQYQTFSLAPGALALPAEAPMAARVTDGRTPMEDLTGAAWRGGAARAADGTRVFVFVTDPRLSERPGGVLPSEAFGLSDAAAAPAFGAPAVRVGVETRAFAARAGDLDFEVSPSAGVSSGFGERSVGAGVTARLGQNLDQRGGGSNAWYLFAGAGARAVEIDPTRRGFGISDAQMRNKAIVGDAQAGLAFDLGPADLALAYSRRERPIEWAKDQHDGFAVLSLSIRH